MTGATSSHWWLGRFAERLLQLNPRTSWRSAVSRAVANYHRAAFLLPDEAAYICWREASRPARRPAWAVASAAGI
jgi:hypothetical protein